MVQSQVELMKTNFKFEAPDYLILQVQIITYITYQSVMGILTYFHSIVTQDKLM